MSSRVRPPMQHDAQLDYYGRKLATCSSDRTIKVYDVSGDETAQSAELGGCVGRPRLGCPSNVAPRRGVHSQPRGAGCSVVRYARLLSGALSRAIGVVHATQNWLPLRTLPTPQHARRRHEGPVWQVAWAHPQFGALLASCGYDRRVLVQREVAPGQWSRILSWEEHASSVNAVVWAPHEYGLQLAAASSDGRVSVLTHRGAWAGQRRRCRALRGLRGRSECRVGVCVRRQRRRCTRSSRSRCGSGWRSGGGSVHASRLCSACRRTAAGVLLTVVTRALTAPRHADTR